MRAPLERPLDLRPPVRLPLGHEAGTDEERGWDSKSFKLGESVFDHVRTTVVEGDPQARDAGVASRPQALSERGS